jgi:tetratricopeptide (TPR) repeat protein
VKQLALIGILALSLVSACSKPDASALFAKGNDYFDKKMLAEAVVQYKSAIQADPKRGDVRSKLADVYLQQRDLRGALREAVNAADLLPGDIKAQVRAGNLLLLAHSWEDANSRADKAIALDSKSAEALVLKANSLAGLQKFDDALDQYQEALVLNPGSEQIYASIGVIQAEQGQLKEAEATFRKAVDLSPKAVTARMALANFLWASQRVVEAEAEFKAALVLDPSNLNANRALGGFYMSNGRGAEAEPYFKAIAAAASTDTAQLALADYYLTQRRTDDAKRILTPLSEKAESFGPASLRLAAIEASRNNRGVAATIVRSVLDKTPKFTPARLLELRLLVLDNKQDEAMAAATALIKDEPNTAAAAEANFAIGGIEAGRDRTEEATKAYEEVLRIQSNSIPGLLALAQLTLRTGNVDKAEAYVRQALTVTPGSAIARSLLVRVLLVRGDMVKATAELASLEKAFPNAVPVQNLVAARNLAAGKTEAARASYAKVLDVAPNDLEALQGMVVLDLQAGRKKDAVDRVDAAIKRMPASADLYLLGARAHFAAGNFARTEELLKDAIEREPARLAAYGLLGQLYIGQNRLGDAKDRYQDLVKRSPKSVPVNTVLGMILEAQKDLPAAEAQYQKTLNIDPAAAVAANNLAWIYVASNRNLDQALQYAQVAQRSLPDEPHVNDTLGWAYYRKGMFPQAARSLEASLKKDTSDAAVYYHLGMAYSQTGDIEKAKAALQKALSMSKSFEGVEEARKTLADLR